MLIKHKKQSFLEKFYLKEIIQGLYITIKNMFFGKKVTIEYPEEHRVYSNRYRGIHYLKTTNGVENCTACMLCSTVCPAECIHIIAGTRPDKEKYPIQFNIDLLRCCFCGMCEESCPKDAIKLSTLYDMSTTTHEILDKDFLIEQRNSK